jgi:hypothetical protein
MSNYFDAEGSQVTPDTVSRAASDGVCARTKAVYQYFMVWTQELFIFFVLISICIFIESENKKGWSPCGLS